MRMGRAARIAPSGGRRQKAHRPRRRPHWWQSANTPRRSEQAVGSNSASWALSSRCGPHKTWIRDASKAERQSSRTISEPYLNHGTSKAERQSSRSECCRALGTGGVLALAAGLVAEAPDDVGRVVAVANHHGAHLMLIPAHGRHNGRKEDTRQNERNNCLRTDETRYALRRATMARVPCSNLPTDGTTDETTVNFHIPASWEHSPARTQFSHR